MEIKTKSNILIIGTFIIGMLIGSIVTITIVSPSSRSKVDFRERGSFSNRMLDIVQPKPEQVDSLTFYLKKYEQKMLIHHKQSMNEFRLTSDSLKDDLSRFLNEDQVKLLENYYNERKEQYRKRRGKRTDRDNKKSD